MHGAQAYRRQTTPIWTRIDAILALYAKAFEDLDKAEALLGGPDASAAVPLLIHAQNIVASFATGLDVQSGDKGAVDLLKLYEYVTHQLSRTSVEGVREARKILATLREGFEGAQEQARQLERTGALPPFAANATYQATV